MITVASAAYNKFQEPDNEYLLISGKTSLEFAEKLKEISPIWLILLFAMLVAFLLILMKRHSRNG
ncbi:MAG: hypothetical protein R3B93_26805 [Bacteroidia bacterium]